MKHLIRLATLLVAALLLASMAFGQAVLDQKLQNKMLTEAGPFEVIVTFKDLADVNSLSVLGVNFLPLTTLPMAGAVLTASQIDEVLTWETVESVYFNDRLEYFNYTSGQITGGHYVHDVYGVKGKGVTVLVLDSGVDANHPDLQYGTKTVQNVKIVGDLGLAGGLTLYVEGVSNTDNTSGHGTHVAGTVAGTGAASATDARRPYYYAGIAPEATLVGVGAGEALFILHALIGFDYAIANKDRLGISVITNSWGSSTPGFDPNNPINKASFRAYQQGIVVTFAAGNAGPGDNTLNPYATVPWVVGVAAGDATKKLADFSSRGVAGDEWKHPDITAPGVRITSTRAVGTPIGALGPVVNTTYPHYYTYYHTISGTSMATPFVAGTTALLLSVNSNLSPDQIEDIITSTADPMPGYAYHQVGTGYINVRRAVEKAATTAGNRVQFLTGDTKWSSQGNWVIVQEDNSDLGYYGTWQTISDASASGGTYKVGLMKTKGKGKKVSQKPLLRVTFYGTAVKLGYPTNSEGGTAEVLIDGISRGTISFYSDQPQWDVRSAYAGLKNTNHTLELRALRGKVYFDNLYLDGKLFPSNTQFVDETTTYTGTMGPSVEGIPETRLIPFEVSNNTLQISAELGWSGGVDIDLYLLDPDGKQVASSASLDNPEVLSYWVTRPGTYSYKLVGYATVVADYTLTSTLTKAISSQPAASQSASHAKEAIAVKENAAPGEFNLFQNYPNPFNPTTSITYQLPHDGFVKFKIYDVLGREMVTLVDGAQSAGLHSVTFNASGLPSGVYYYRIDVNDSKGNHFSRVNKMALMK